MVMHMFPAAPKAPQQQRTAAAAACLLQAPVESHAYSPFNSRPCLPFQQNLMAWAVAGGLAYYLWVVPIKQRDDEQQRVREQVSS